MDNLWFAQKSSNRTLLWFTSGRLFLPITRLRVSLLLLTWVLKSPSKTTASSGTPPRGSKKARYSKLSFGARAQTTARIHSPIQRCREQTQGKTPTYRRQADAKIFWPNCFQFCTLGTKQHWESFYFGSQIILQKKQQYSVTLTSGDACIDTNIESTDPSIDIAPVSWKSSHVCANTGPFRQPPFAPPSLPPCGLLLWSHMT